MRNTLGRAREVRRGFQWREHRRIRSHSGCGAARGWLDFGCAPGAGWNGSGPPAAASLDRAPVLSLASRVRGKLVTSAPLYVRIDPAARNRYDLAIDGVGDFEVEAVLVSGERQTVAQSSSVGEPGIAWLPPWLGGVASWGAGSSLGDAAYLVITPHLRKGSTGAYELTVYDGAKGYRP